MCVVAQCAMHTNSISPPTECLGVVRHHCLAPQISTKSSTKSSTSSPSPVGPGCYALVGSQHLSPLHTGSPRVTSTGGDELRAVMITWRAASQRGSVPWYVPIVHETRIGDGGWFTHRLSLPLLCIISICPPASGWHNRHTATSRLFGGMWEKQDATIDYRATLLSGNCKSRSRLTCEISWEAQ